MQKTNETKKSCESNLAKYKETSGNDCYLPGSATPSPIMSHHVVTLTTQNYNKIVQPAQHTYTRFIDRTNEQEQCHRVALDLQVTPVLPIDPKEINQDEANAPFQDFVNFINNNEENGNNIIVQV